MRSRGGAPSSLQHDHMLQENDDQLAALGGKVYPDECTWCLAEKGSELQLMLACAGGDAKWASLLKDA